MKDIAKIIRVSIKKEFKKLKNKSPIFCNSLKKEININNIYLNHIDGQSKDRELKDVISKLPIINLIEEILEEGALIITRNEGNFIYHRIESKIGGIIFSLIISETKNGNYTLLSSFAKIKKSSSQDVYPRRPTRVQSLIFNGQNSKKENKIVNSKQIKKAIIPIAGLGSRFLPITKSVGKEMLNIIDKPVIHYIFEECVNSGIEEFVFVIGENQKLVQDYFDLNSEYCKKIFSSGNQEKIAKLNELKKILDGIKINYAIQKNPKGDGDAILRAEKFFNEGENFAILFGDDLIQNEKNPGIGQLIKNFSELEKKFSNEKKFIIGVQKIFGEEIKNYGVIDKNSPIQKIQEKPEYKDAISDLGIIGKYICNFGIFEAIKNGNKSNDGEIRLSNGFEKILENGEGKIFGKIIEGERYDTGSKIGLIKATIGFGIEKSEEYKKEILDFIKKF